MFVRLGYRKKVESTKKKSKHLGHYDTPTELGKKWQLDVKYVPTVCYVGTDGEKFYQYTMIEEASRERFLYAYKENSSYSTVDFVHRAILYFGYARDMIQTDNGGEFYSHTKRQNAFILWMIFGSKLHILHKTIRPKTPWHNGKVERSHRNDQEAVL
ncbi:MAG: DDE-type integrase/transposase/recombinase [Clostridia bacterium]